MTTRTTSRTLRFSHPFTLDGNDERYPAGDYLVQTDEEMIEGLSFVAWRRVGTVLHVSRGGATQAITVDPRELDATQWRDAGSR